MTRTNLTAHERRTYRQRLQELRERLPGEMLQLEAEVLHPNERDDCAVPSQGGDRPVRTAEEDRARTVIASESHILEEVTAALGRLAKGSFGVCEQCGHRVAKARLDTIPYARTCIRCARSAATAATH